MDRKLTFEKVKRNLFQLWALSLTTGKGAWLRNCCSLPSSSRPNSVTRRLGAGACTQGKHWYIPCSGLPRGTAQSELEAILGLVDWKTLFRDQNSMLNLPSLSEKDAWLEPHNRVLDQLLLTQILLVQDCFKCHFENGEVEDFKKRGWKMERNGGERTQGLTEGKVSASHCPVRLPSYWMKASVSSVLPNWFPL